MTVKDFLRRTAVFLVGFLALSSAPVFAQESEPVVVDEVVAQVNDGVITLSAVRRQKKAAIEGLVQQGRKTPEDAQREIEAKSPELIASLINEELLLQQGKEMGLEQEVESEVNQRFEAIRKEQNLKTLDELYQEMRRQGVEPDEVKNNMRKEFMKGMVLRYGVDGKIYNGLTEKEVKAYFESHKDKFKKPETVTLSEVFLSFAGKKEADVTAAAADIVKKARANADFKQLVAQYSEREDSKKENGKVGSYDVANLSDVIGNAVKNVKAGGVTDPIRTDEGIIVLRVDERSADSNVPTFDDRRVREAITVERLPQERKKYLATLRTDAYIKISNSYRDAVTKMLDSTEAAN